MTRARTVFPRFVELDRSNSLASSPSTRGATALDLEVLGPAVRGQSSSIEPGLADTGKLQPENPSRFEFRHLAGDAERAAGKVVVLARDLLRLGDQIVDALRHWHDLRERVGVQLLRNYCLDDLASVEIDETKTHVGGLFAQTTENAGAARGRNTSTTFRMEILSAGTASLRVDVRESECLRWDPAASAHPLISVERNA